MRQYAFYFVALSFLLGVAFATLFAVSSAVLLLSGVIAGGLLAVSYKNRRDKHAPGILIIAFSLLFFVGGAGRTEAVRTMLTDSPLQQRLGQSVTVEGVIREEPDRRAKSTHLMVETEEDTILVTTDAFTESAYGDRVQVQGTLQVPQSFTTDLGHEFDYPQYLLARKVVYTIPFAKVTTLKTNEGNPVVAHLLVIKHTLMTGIESVITEPAAGLGEGLLLGVKQGLSDDLEGVFRTAGIIHIVVLSGYNIMLVVSFTLFLFSNFLPRTVRLLLALSLVCLFALLVGLSATVVRATIMVILFLIASLLYRSYDLTRSLLFAAVVMVFLSPFLLLYDIGFQLSFMATLGLIMVAPKVETILGGRGGLKEYLIATIATQLAVLPLLLYYMGQVSLIAIPVNLLVLPLVPLAMLLTATSGMMALLTSTIALPFAYAAHLVLHYIIGMAQLAASLPGATLTIPYFPLSFLIGAYALMGLLLTRRSRHSASAAAVGDWVIVEESSIKADKTPSISSASTDTPVFFR